jgi:flagellar basal-body rod protein FlgC
MDSAMAIAASGIGAATSWLDAAASNIANMRSSGPVPGTPQDQPLPPGSGVYQAVTVQQTAQSSGGVSTSFAPVLPSWLPGFDSGAQTVTAEPNVDLAGQFVSMIEARAAFGASIAAFKAADSTEKSLLNLIA